MSDDRKYARVYYDDMIRDYPEIWTDDAALATWARMLSTADSMWPTPPEVPRSVKAGPLGRLTASTLVELLPMNRYRIKGLDTERNARRDAGRNAAAVRWQSKSNAGAMPSRAMPSRAMPTRAEPSTTQDEPTAPDPFDDPEHEALVWLAGHGCDIRPGNGYHRKLVTAVEVHGTSALVLMMQRLADAGTKQGDIKGFLFGAIDALDAKGRPKLAALEKADRESETDAAHRRRLAATQRELAAYRGEPA